MRSAAIVLTLALAASTVMAQPTQQQPMGHANPGQMLGRMAMMQKLNLTEDQQAQIRKIHVDFQRKQIQNQAKVRLARLDLAQMMQADKPDRSGIEKAVRDISSIETDTKLARVDEMLAIRNVLTPDQLKVWKEQRMGRGRMMHGEMMRDRMMIHRERGGMMGESMAPAPGDEQLGMAALPDPMDPPMPMEELELDDLGAE